MSLGTILLVILVLFLIGALPTWPHSANWGYYPSSGLGRASYYRILQHIDPTR